MSKLNTRTVATASDSWHEVASHCMEKANGIIRDNVEVTPEAEALVYKAACATSIANSLHVASLHMADYESYV